MKNLIFFIKSILSGPHKSVYRTHYHCSEKILLKFRRIIVESDNSAILLKIF